VGRLYIGEALEVGNGSGNLKNPVVGTGGQSQFIDGRFQQRSGIIIDLAVFLDVTAAHLGVGVNLGSGKPFGLDSASRGRPFADVFRGLCFPLFSKILVGDGRNLHVDIDPIQKRTGYFGSVSVNMAVAAPAGMFRI